MSENIRYRSFSPLVGFVVYSNSLANRAKPAQKQSRKCSCAVLEVLNLAGDDHVTWPVSWKMSNPVPISEGATAAPAEPLVSPTAQEHPWKERLFPEEEGGTKEAAGGPEPQDAQGLEEGMAAMAVQDQAEVKSVLFSML